MCGRNAILLSVASYENKEISGTAVCPALHRRCVFSNLTQLLLKMEDMLNELNTPQRAMELRTFGSWREQPSPQEERESAGPVLATMKVTVLFRQNASWQGTVEWTEQRMEAHFRSVLELIMLMDSALTAAQGEQKLLSCNQPVTFGGYTGSIHVQCSRLER